MNSSGGGAGAVESAIREKLLEALQPVHLDILNESSGHGGYFPGKESHFKVVVVSSKFEKEEGGKGIPLIKRHRMVNECLAKELEGAIHALSIVAKTPKQWEANPTVAKSPPCRGGGV